MSDAHRPSLVDRFERRFVLSTSRALFLVIAVLAALALFGGGAVFAYSMTPTLRGLDPRQPDPPAPPTVTLADVLGVLDAPEEYSGDYEEDDGGSSFVDAQLAAGTGVGSGQATEFAELAARLGTFFDVTRYPWLSETHMVCTYRTRYTGCLNWDKRTIRKGIVEILNESLERLAGPEQLEVLRALVETMPLCLDEDTRFMAVGTVLDLANAAGTVNADEMVALREMLAAAPAPVAPVVAPAVVSPPTAEGTVAAAPTEVVVPPPAPPSAAQDYLTAVLKARKKGNPPALVAAWLRSVPTLYTAFGNDAQGKPNRVDGLVATWQALQGTLPDLATQRIEGIRAIAAEAPEARRPEVVRVYGDLVRSRAAEAQRGYEDALAEREMAIRKLDAAVVETDDKKSGLRTASTSVVGSAFTVIAGVGLLLALLAVERNTRALRDVLARLEAAPSKPAEPAAEVTGKG